MAGLLGKKMIHPDYYKSAAVYLDTVPVEPIQLLELYPFAFATVLKYLTRERYHGTQAQDLSKALTYLHHCRALCIVYPVHALTQLELRIVNEFRKKYSLIGTLLNTSGVSDAARMADTENELERAIAQLTDGGLDE